MARMIDAEEAELERAAAVAQAQAITFERWGYAAAVAVAILVAAGGWVLSIPLAVVAYQLTARPYYKALKAADDALESYRASRPEPSTSF